jgi:endonuclease/exonuclease/phosphatase (EEP) superfamily protein YafD
VRQLARGIRWGLGLLILLYALVVGALQFAWQTGVVNTWWLEVLNIFGLWLYLPLPLGVLAAAFARPRMMTWLLLVPLLAFGWDYHALLNADAAPAEGTAFRVMTWNILWSPHPLEPIVRTIEEQQPDIVALQELGVEQAAALAPMLAQRYPYSAVNAGEVDGLGVWSRFPITEAAPSEQRHDGCACQRMVVMVDGTPIRLLNAHPQAPSYHLQHRRPWTWLPYFPIPVAFTTEHQEVALGLLAEEGQNTKEPLIMMGDFNVSDRHPHYRLLRSSVNDAYREAGRGFGLTFPNAHVQLGRFKVPPLIRIDYVFHNDALEATAAHTVADPASDHRAVVADLVLLGNAFTADTTSINRTQR